ncbi:MAG TPA: MltA domain-containing protein [Thermoanaerobaculia bacterium]|nr:MltA domain-containing protein [Thermoanaerobaculia bacterium]
MTRRRKIVPVVTLALALLALGLGLYLRFRAPRPPIPIPDRLVLTPAGFADLPGWREDDLAAALPVFLRSCARIGRLAEGAAMGGAEDLAGTAGEWKSACVAAARVPAANRAAARSFFEATFTPVAASNHGERQGLFTGYYEPTLHGSRKPGGRYAISLYRRPPELVVVDLGLFREEWKGRRIAGRVHGGALLPYPDRAEIRAGSLAGRGLELAWVDDPVDAFFLEIQGSGRIELAEGGVLRVGFAAQNGHPYFAIGHDLVERGALKQEEVSLQSIRAWLLAHPVEAPQVMARNRSYVFFEELKGEGPLGAEGAVLTPGRSLAVDLKYLSLGTPVWLDGQAPATVEKAPDRPLRRLLVAQDTGGAIRGPVRGDVFWGHGEAAAAVAGRMKHPGRIWLLLPKAAAARLATRPQ